MARFADRVVVVTGAGTGIGRVTAVAFAREGAHVALAGRRAAPLEETAAAVEALGRRALVQPTDVALPDDVDRLVAHTVERLGPIDVLVNNAATPGSDMPVAEMDLENWNRTLAVDLTGTMLMCRAVLQSGMLARRRGAIVNVSSTAGKRGIPGKAHYCAAKYALLAFTRTLAQEVGVAGIRVNTVVPGSIDTELLHGYHERLARARGSTAEAVRAEAARQIVLGQITTPEEVAAVILFLASDAASALTGQDVNVAGGSEMR
jgi:NAD(P)-dependent dehydrogenase (short-subunit alcohol dehydrogenase family)